jgi:uncharacterized membrane protein YccC
MEPFRPTESAAAALRAALQRRLGGVLRASLRTVLSSHVTNGLSAAIGLLAITTLIHGLMGSAAAAAAMVGVIVVTPPDQPGPRRGKLGAFLPAVLLGTPLFFATLLLRGHPAALALLLMGAGFVAFLCAAWGKRGLPVSASLVFAAMFALATPTATGMDSAVHETLAFSLGAWLYILWGTLANSLLNGRYRVLAAVNSLGAVAALMRAQGLQFTMPRQAQQRTALAGRLMKLQADLTDQLQGARNLLLEDPATSRRLRLAGMLVQLIELRDHLIACALDLDALRDAPEQQALLQVLGIEIQALAGDLELLAEALRLGRRPAPFIHARPALAAAAAALPEAAEPAEWAPSHRRLAQALARRVGHVHDEVALLVALARGERQPDADVVRSAWPLFVSPARWTWAPLRTLWRRDAPPLRHGIRAALAIGAGYGVALALPWAPHESWILMTIGFVLRGNLAQTVERRNHRVVGTLLGCVLAAGLLYAHPPALLLLLVVALAYGLAHAFVLQRYVVTAVAASVLALVQVHTLNGGALAPFDVVERMLDTLGGVGIAWAFSYVLPSWERTQLAALVERALAAQARYAQAALALGRPGPVDAQSQLAWRLARRDAYDSLSAIVQAVQRSLAEPRAVQPPLHELERLLVRSWQLLAHLTATKTMLLRRRDRLDIARLQGPLEDAARRITIELAPATHPSRATTLAHPAAQADHGAGPAGQGLSPWLLRRLRLAVRAAAELHADAQQAAAMIRARHACPAGAP